MNRKYLVFFVVGLGLLPCATAYSFAAGRNALQNVVENLCVRGQRTANNPFPCQEVDLKRGFAVLRVAGGHLLLIPTASFSGIESPDLIAKNAPNYWAYAWEARSGLDKIVGKHLPREDTGLAINSAQARTQDQLHIHIGCISPSVKAALEVYENKIGTTWSKLPFGVGGHRYRIMRIDGHLLGTANPFALLANGIPSARTDMASQTLVVVGARLRNGKEGFYALTNQTGSQGAASGEGLLDFTCSVSARLR